MPAIDPAEPAEGFPRGPWIAALAWGLATFFLLLLLRAGSWQLAGTDAFFHLSVAQWIGENGFRDLHLPWTRFSLFAEQWGDKEFLFHALLVPFSSAEKLQRGGVIALCLFNALQSSLLAWIGLRWFGRRGAWLPVAVAAANAGVWLRYDLLRPHLLSMMLLLLAALAISRSSKRGLAFVSFLYPLCYTAWQTLWILCVFVAGILWFFRRERLWYLVLIPPLGLAAGIFAHPAFPANINVWYHQNIVYFLIKNSVSVGVEIYPLTTAQFLLSASPALFFLFAAFFTTYPWTGAGPVSRNEMICAGFAVPFSVLTLLSYRFIEYAAPFLACYFFFLLNRLCLNPKLPSEFRRRRDLLLASLLVYAAGFNFLIARITSAPEEQRVAFKSTEDEIQFRNALPEGARVAAQWDSTSHYIFAAPQAAYLNVLDPVFMYAVDPKLAYTETAFFSGASRNPAYVVEAAFDSEYVALHGLKKSRLLEQLTADPRFSLHHDGRPHRIFRLVPAEKDNVNSD